MKINQWTLGLAAVGLVSLPSGVPAEEKPNNLLTSLSSTTISGYVNTTAVWRPGTSTAGIPGRAFDAPASKQDGFNLDVVSLTIAKPLDEDLWSAGYTAQLWFGPDAVGFNLGPGAAASDFAVKQAYVELRAPVGNGLSFKMGHFNYIGGYEMPDAGDNPNYSRSYAWTLEPASHTGLVGSYKVNESINLMAGVANTYNNGVNGRAARAPAGKPSETEKTYMAQVALTAPESFGFMKGATLSGTVVNGLNNASGSAGSVLTAGHITCYQVGGTLPTVVKNLAIGASYDYMDGAPLAFTAQNKSAYANAVTLYSMFQATEKLKLNTRGEYTTATSGFWYGQAAGATAHGSRLLGVTGTADYSIWKNVLSRLEARWDHSLTGDRPYGGRGATPVGNQKNTVTVVANIIYKF